MKDFHVDITGKHHERFTTDRYSDFSEIILKIKRKLTFLYFKFIECVVIIVTSIYTEPNCLSIMNNQIIINEYSYWCVKYLHNFS